MSFLIGILSAVVSARVFYFIDSKMKLSEKLHSRIKGKKPQVRYVFFIAIAMLTGVLSAVLGRAALEIFNSEMLREITSWAVLGAGFVLLFSGMPPQSE